MAQRLVGGGEWVVDVPAKLAARVRVLSVGHGRKSDPDDAVSVAVAAQGAPGLRRVGVEGHAVVLLLLTKRREDLVTARTQTINRLHRLLVDLVPAGAGRNLTAKSAAALLRQACPSGIAARTRHQLATGLIGDISDLDRRIASVEARIKTAVAQSKTSLVELFWGRAGAGCHAAGRGRRRAAVPDQTPLCRSHRHRAACGLQRPGHPAPFVTGR